MNILDMNLFYALIIGIVFVLLCHKPIKKNPPIFYGIALILAIATGVVVWLGLVSHDETPFILYKLYNVMRKAVVATVLFLMVMYAGVLPSSWGLTKSLKSVRGELAVFATILTWGHNIPYLFAPKYAFLYKTFIGDLSWNKVVALILTIVMMVILAILAVTSLRPVRRKMSAKSWKALQAPLSYAFYALLYAHLMVLYLPKYINKGRHLSEVVVYSVIFGVYLILRVSKALKAHKA
ncbi:MAG: ferric reductase-like transmembrane domain-containing protein [Eubacteriales bacterium]|nr:ferric reductase-like transmembrane domain-containing protein [Eubacteriales bacterium]